MMYTNSIEGWISPVELNWLYVQASRFKSIMEVGSYHGRSTTALCDGCKGEVYAVDNFDDQHYEAFLKNVSSCTNLTVYREASVEAALRFEDKSLDMVFLDGDHSYESVRDDIEAWKPKCRFILCGHDYTDDGIGHWPGVVQAVNERFPKIVKIETIWAVML